MITQDGEVLRVAGDFNHGTAAALLAAGEPLVAAQDCVIDLSGVAAVDSSAVAVVLGWMRAARAAGRSLHLTAAPAAFLSLASLYGVSEFVLPPTGSPARESV